MDLKICAKKTCNRSGFPPKISSQSSHFSKIYDTSKSVHFFFDLTVSPKSRKDWMLKNTSQNIFRGDIGISFIEITLRITWKRLLLFAHVSVCSRCVSLSWYSWSCVQSMFDIFYRKYSKRPIFQGRTPGLNDWIRCCRVHSSLFMSSIFKHRMQYCTPHPF